MAEDPEGLEEQFSEEARAMSDRVRIPIGTAMHLAVNHPKWAGDHLGETIYVYTLRILKRMGHASM